MTDFRPYPVENVHRIIEPGPTILVTTSDGITPNLMTNGFNMPVRHDGLIALVLGPWDASFTTLSNTRECVIALPGIELMEKVVDIGNCSGADVDKWDRFGLTPAPARSVKAPLVAECFANVECVVEDDRLVNDYDLWILRARYAWVRDPLPAAAEFHHRGDGTFSTNADVIDLRDHMTKWRHLHD